jgi:hypothetical protein
MKYANKSFTVQSTDADAQKKYESNFDRIFGRAQGRRSAKRAAAAAPAAVVHHISRSYVHRRVDKSTACGGGPFDVRTGEADKVTCPKCKRTST